MTNVEDEANVLETEEPAIIRSSGAVKDYIHHLIDVLIPSFGEVLMLLVRLTLPGPYK